MAGDRALIDFTAGAAIIAAYPFDFESPSRRFLVVPIGEPGDEALRKWIEELSSVKKLQVERGSHMAESKRILSSPLATVEFATTQLRLIGAANAAGFAAAGAAFQAATLSSVQQSLKVLMFLFLLGVIAFAVASVTMAFATFAADGMEGSGEEDQNLPRDQRVYKKTTQQYGNAYLLWIIPTCLLGGISLLLFFWGLISTAITLVKI